MGIKYKHLSFNNTLQEKVNLDFDLALNNKGINYHEHSGLIKHKLFNKYMSICNKCKVFRHGYMGTTYIQNPKMVIIGRSNTSSDLKYSSLLSSEIPSNSVIIELCSSLGYSFKNCYYTNMVLCTMKNINNIHKTHCDTCKYYKSIELSTMNIPDVFLLLGNDALNSYFDLNCSVNHILGDVYVSNYLGRNRLFIPVPHPVYLLRDNTLRVNTNKLLIAIKGFIDNGLLDKIQEVSSC